MTSTQTALCSFHKIQLEFYKLKPPNNLMNEYIPTNLSGVSTEQQN